METRNGAEKCAKASVLIAQAESVTRLGLIHLINGHTRLWVCAEAETAAAARDLCERHQPAAVITDPELDGGGTGLLRDVARCVPHARIIVFSGIADVLSVQRCLAAGALGYVTRQDAPADLLATVLHALEGQRHVSPHAERLVLERLALGEMTMLGVAEAALSDRELQVFRLIGLGRTMREIAAELHVSTKTVETHRHRIKLKLRLSNGGDLQRRAFIFCQRSDSHLQSSLSGLSADLQRTFAAAGAGKPSLNGFRLS